MRKSQSRTSRWSIMAPAYLGFQTPKAKSSSYDVGRHPQYKTVLAEGKECPRYPRQAMNGEASDRRMRKRNECDPVSK